MPLSCFISHSHRDERIANALVSFLKEGVGLDQKDIRCTSQLDTGLVGGAIIEDQIRKDIKGCKFFVPLVTENSLASEFVGFEIGAAWALQKQFIMPLVFMPVDKPNVPSLLKKYLYRDATQLDQLIQFAHELNTEIWYKPDRATAAVILAAAKTFLSHVRA